MKSQACFSLFINSVFLLWASLGLAAASPVRGTVEKISQDSITINSSLGKVTADLGPKVQFLKRVPSNLSKVTPQTFVGVTTVKQADGKELATEIHIFPENLRGTNEGSFMMETPASSTGPQSRMTNGTVTSARTKKTTSGSRMTNGTVKTKEGSTAMMVQFKGGEQAVIIPDNVTVTEVVLTAERPTPGSAISFVPEKKADGSYTTSRINLLESTAK